MLCSWAQMEPCREVTAPGEARETWIYRRLAPRATACLKPLWGRAALAGAQAQTSCGKPGESSCSRRAEDTCLPQRVASFRAAVPTLPGTRDQCSCETLVPDDLGWSRGCKCR